MTLHARPRRWKRKVLRGVSGTAMVAERAVTSTRTRSTSGARAWPVKLLRSLHELALSFSGMLIAMAYWACRSVASTRVSRGTNFTIFSLSPSSLSHCVCEGEEQNINGSQLMLVRPVQQETFFDNAKSSLSKPLFAVDLKKNAPGSYSFGFIDNSKYKGTITYVPVDSSDGFWQFTSKGYSVGSSSSFKSVSIDAIADTGTTLLYLPDAIVQDYYSAIPSASYSSFQGGYVFPCNASLPRFSIGIGTYTAVIPGPFINYAPTDEFGRGMFLSFFPSTQYFLPTWSAASLASYWAYKREIANFSLVAH